jgi:hypothetical protein
MDEGEQMIRLNLAALEAQLLERGEELEEMQAQLHALRDGLDVREALEAWMNRAIERAIRTMADIREMHDKAKALAESALARRQA